MKRILYGRRLVWTLVTVCSCAVVALVITAASEASGPEPSAPHRGYMHKDRGRGDKADHEAQGSAQTFSSSEVTPLAEKVAGSAGAVGQFSIEHALGTREAGLALMSNSGGGIGTLKNVDLSAESYVVVLHGNFQPPAYSVAGHAGPNEPFSTLILIVNATTGQITDSLTTNASPDLASVGSVVIDSTAANPT